MGGKRVRSPSASDGVKADGEGAAPLKRVSSLKRISNGSLGKMERSREALASLNTKKTEREIWEHVTPFQRTTTDADFDATKMYKVITWNVAGLRGVLKKDAAALKDFLAAEQPDILCLQETKLNVDDAAANAGLGVVDGYVFVDHPCAYKKGYSGTRTYMRTSSMVEKLNAQCTRGFTLLPDSASAAPGALAVGGAGDDEGRVLTTFLSPGSCATTSSGAPSAAAPRLAIVNVYVPNSGMGLDRLPHRIQSFDPLMREYLKKLDEWSKADDKTGGSAATLNAQPHGFIWTGDLNVAERDYDRYYAGTFKTMQECSGFTPEERSSFRSTMAATDSVDVFRHLYPNAGPVYTFWSMRINGRAKGLGWRLDYFVVSSRLMPYVVDCFPMPEVTKSDHCPVQLWLRKP
ncbi:apurinic/apyrimidinic endonuclease-redox protein AP-endonuclease [Leptomonas seymouri]|uniref:DNA-(apurinic or apyrimidinic site) endonuclease n=1 Tax=Leptomonas seymouri TaxID=5684 RepID=A0A0N1IIW7_LEPSE|nr:apurinic/apyrimidinic endonuclease-redox protein AP-endonuclease [Leptomonas seymouri]|eukprot:KPI85124.1 apurinic/apyrimidinic endonuclease-redox protein AP-endonuclease [Leptomonas seymouri]